MACPRCGSTASFVQGRCPVCGTSAADQDDEGALTFIPVPADSGADTMAPGLGEATVVLPPNPTPAPGTPAPGTSGLGPGSLGPTITLRVGEDFGERYH